MKKTFQERITLAALLASLALSTAGCGGGGGGGSSSPSPSNTATVTGIVQDNNVPADRLGGYRVIFDQGTANAVTATTSSTGQYTLTIPLTSLTSQDTLTVLDPSGASLNFSQPVTVSQSGSTVNLTVNIPPPPPAPPAARM